MAIRRPPRATSARTPSCRPRRRGPHRVPRRGRPPRRARSARSCAAGDRAFCYVQVLSFHTETLHARREEPRSFTSVLEDFVARVQREGARSRPRPAPERGRLHRPLQRGVRHALAAGRGIRPAARSCCARRPRTSSSTRSACRPRAPRPRAPRTTRSSRAGSSRRSGSRDGSGATTRPRSSRARCARATPSAATREGGRAHVPELHERVRPARGDAAQLAARGARGRPDGGRGRQPAGGAEPGRALVGSRRAPLALDPERRDGRAAARPGAPLAARAERRGFFSALAFENRPVAAGRALRDLRGGHHRPQPRLARAGRRGPLRGRAVREGVAGF